MALGATAWCFSGGAGFCDTTKSLQLDVQPCKSITPKLITRVPSYKVSEIVIEGNSGVSTRKILKAVRTKVGDGYDRESIASDLEAVCRVYHFDRQRLVGFPELTSSGMKLRIQVGESYNHRGYPYDFLWHQKPIVPVPFSSGSILISRNADRGGTPVRLPGGFRSLSDYDLLPAVLFDEERRH